MVMGSKQQQHVTCHRQRPDWPFFFVCLVPLNPNPPAKFNVCSFSLSRDNRGPKFKLVTRSFPRPFLIICLVSLALNTPAKFDVCSIILTRDNREVPKLKSRSRDLVHALFGPIFIFLFSIRYPRSACKI